MIKFKCFCISKYLHHRLQYNAIREFLFSFIVCFMMFPYSYTILDCLAYLYVYDYVACERLVDRILCKLPDRLTSWQIYNVISVRALSFI